MPEPDFGVKSMVSPSLEHLCFVSGCCPIHNQKYRQQKGTLLASSSRSTLYVRAQEATAMIQNMNTATVLFLGFVRIQPALRLCSTRLYGSMLNNTSRTDCSYARPELAFSET
jgi:hypothetical protein